MMPLRPAAPLVGRDPAFKAISAAFQRGARRVCLAAPHGRGLSSVARVYAALTAAHHPGGVIWLASAEDDDELLAAAAALGVPSSLAAVERALLARPDALILADAEHPYRGPREGPRTLIVTPRVPPDFADPIVTLPELALHEAAALGAPRVLRDVIGGEPLALVIARDLAEREPAHLLAAEIAAAISASRARLRDEHWTHPLLGVIDVWWRRLDETSRALVIALALTGPSGIMSASRAAELAQIAELGSGYPDALAALVSRGLVERLPGDRLALQAAIAQWIREIQGEAWRAAYARANAVKVERIIVPESVRPALVARAPSEPTGEARLALAASLSPSDEAVMQIAFLPTGELLGLSYEGVAHLWDPGQSAELLRRRGAAWTRPPVYIRSVPPPHERPFWASLSRDGTLAASTVPKAMSRAGILLWETTTGAPIARLPREHEPDLVFTRTPAGNVALSLRDGLEVWDPARAVLLRRCSGESLALSRDGRLHALRTGEGLRVEEIDTGLPIALVPGFDETGAHHAISLDGRLFAVTGHGHALQLVDTAAGSAVKNASFRDASGWSLDFTALALTPSGKHAFVATEDGRLHALETASGAVIGRVEIPGRARVRALVLGPRLVALDGAAQLHFFDLELLAQ
jgi:hypothetical protein